MRIVPLPFIVAALFVAASAAAQPATPPAQPAVPAPLPPGQSNDPFPAPIPERDGVIRVNVREFATLPDIDGVAARMMNLEDQPATKRLFVNDMRGPIYSVSYDGATVRLYVDINDPKWGVGVQFQGRERGFQSFAFHPQFGQAGSPGFGKFYTYTDTTNMTPPADFTTPGEKPTHDTVLLEWTAKTPGRGHLRWRTTARVDAVASTVRESQRGSCHVQSTGQAGNSRVRLVVCRCGRWWERRRSDAAGAEHGVGVRQDLPHRSAWIEQPQQEIRDSFQQPVS